MPKENHRASQVKEAREIGGVAFITGDQPARVLEPREEAFDFPAALVPTERAAILRQIHAIAPMGRDQFDVDGRQGGIEPVAVIGGIADQARRIVRQKAGVQRLGDERRFVRGGRGDGNGERKTSAVCKRHDLGPLPALGFADAAPFFFALAKEPSMKVSVRSRPPRA